MRGRRREGRGERGNPTLANVRGPWCDEHMATTRETPTTGDRVRQVTVTVSEIACVLGTLVGVGVFGTRVEETSGGSLAADATLLAPATTAFSIWSVIYLGLFVYTIWQWLPSQATAKRHRRIGFLAAISMLLNATWLLVTQQGWIWVSVLVIIVLALCLGMILRNLTSNPASGWADRLITDGTFGLYLGWVAVATCANIAAAGVASGAPGESVLGVLLASVVLVVAAALCWLFRARFGARWGVALAMAWGLGWIAVGRIADEPQSILVGIVAAIAAVACLATLLPLARTSRRAPQVSRVR